MLVIFQGVESHDHRATLETVPGLFEEAPRIVAGISYLSLRRRRLGESYVRETARMFPVCLEAGVSARPLGVEKLLEMEQEYYRFVDACPQITSAIEFDHPALRGNPERFKWSDPRIIPVLHDSDATELAQVLEAGAAVAMPMPTDHTITSLLRVFSAEESTLVAIALAQPDLAAARTAGFTAAMTTSWVAPGRYGEISLWDGAKHHRANSTNKQRLLQTYGRQIESYGFDMDLITNGDARECNRLAAYSLLSWAQHLAGEPGLSDTTEASPSPTTESDQKTSVSLVPAVAVKKRQSVPFPGFGSQQMLGLDRDVDGQEVIKELPVLRTSNESIRQCSGCYLSVVCPAFEAGASCRFNFPVEVRTDVQAKAVLHSMVEMQAARVAFARFAEEVNGGYPDPVVGREMDRLVSMTDRVMKQHERRERLTVSVESESAGGGTGVLSKFFAVRPPPPEVIEAKIVDGTQP